MRRRMERLAGLFSLASRGGSKERSRPFLFSGLLPFSLNAKTQIGAKGCLLRFLRI